MRRRLSILYGAAALGLAPALHAAQVVATWNGGAGNWNNAANWSGGVVPSNNTPAGTSYDVRIDGGKAIASDVGLGASVAIDALTIDSGDRLGVINPSLALSLTANLTNRGVLIAPPLTSAGATTGPKLDLIGTLRGDGTLQGNTRLSGTTNAGLADGTRGLLTFEVATLNAAHTLVTDIASATDYDSVVIGGEALLAGTLRLNRVGSVALAYGTTQRILSAGFSSGAFANVQGVQIDSTRSFAVVYDGAGVNVVTALPGDATLDRRVNFDDLLIIAQQYGKLGGQTWTGADFTGNGATNFDDLLILAQRYGSTTLTSDAAGFAEQNAAFLGDWQRALSMVPEPTAFTALAMLCGTANRRRVDCRTRASHAAGPASI